jgi:hypothetical protein
MNVSNTGKRRRYKIEARLSPFVTTFVPLRWESKNSYKLGM